VTLIVDERIGYLNWDLWRDQLVYLREEAGCEPRIEMLDLKTRRTAALVALGPTSRPGIGLSVSPDGRWVLYSQTDQMISDIFMVENFR
jgi:Tol biopolymer transport system component